jgi:hypothetical protein
MALAAGADEVFFQQAVQGYFTRKPGTVRYFDLEQLEWKDEIRSNCMDIWDCLFIDYDGGIFPCCSSYGEDDLFVRPEDTNKIKIGEQWNVDKFRTIRKFFMNKSNLSCDELPPPCNTCGMCLSFKSDSLREKLL